MERVDNLKRKFEDIKLENLEKKLCKTPSLLNIENRPNVKEEAEKHQRFIQQS